MEDNYLKAFKEVIEILKFVPKESVDKIPQTIIDTFKAKMDNNHKFKVDINKSFEEQQLLDETKAIFANIFRDYWATPYQKEKIKAKEKYDRQYAEKQKEEKYNLDDVFNKKQSIKENINIDNYSNELPVKEDVTLYQKFIDYFKRLFHID